MAIVVGFRGDQTQLQRLFHATDNQQAQHIYYGALHCKALHHIGQQIEGQNVRPW